MMIELVIAACLATGQCQETRVTDVRQDAPLITITSQDNRAASPSVSGRSFSGLLLACSENCGEATSIAGGKEASSATSVRDAADGPFWRTITLGTYRTPGDLRDALRRERIAIGDTASALLDLPSLSLRQAETPVDLTVLSVEELGFGADGASLADIDSQAKRLGLAFCSPEVAFQLPLQYRKQPVGEFLHIAMEPLMTPAGDPVALLVANGGAGQIIVGRRTDPGDLIGPMTKLVFVVSR